MRFYTDQFSAEDQVYIEERFNEILQRDQGMSTGPIANIILFEQFPEVPVSIATLIGKLDDYLYDRKDPAVIREGVTGATLLRFIIKKFFPQFVRAEVSHGIS